MHHHACRKSNSGSRSNLSVISMDIICLERKSRAGPPWLATRPLEISGLPGTGAGAALATVRYWNANPSWPITVQGLPNLQD